MAEGTLKELQDRLGGDRLFVLDGDLKDARVETWEGFERQFRVLQKSERQLVVAAIGDGDPSGYLKALLALPIRIENVTLD